MFSGVPQPNKDYIPKYVDFSIDSNGAYHWKLKQDAGINEAFCKRYSEESYYLVDHDTIIDLDGHNLCILSTYPFKININMFQRADNGNLKIMDSSAKEKGKLTLGSYRCATNRRLAVIPGNVTTNPQVVVDGIRIENGHAFNALRI